MILEAFDIVPPPQNPFLGMILEAVGLVHPPRNLTPSVTDFAAGRPGQTLPKSFLKNDFAGGAGRKPPI